MLAKRLFKLASLLIALNFLAEDQLLAQSDPFPYEKPFPDFPTEYSHCLRHDISVKGPVKSVIQTTNANAYSQWNNPNSVIVKGEQLEYRYDTLGQLISFIKYIVSVKDTFAYHASKSTPLPILQQGSATFSLRKEEVCTYQNGLLVQNIHDDFLREFSFDKHQNLSDIYHYKNNRLIAETHLVFNQFNMPILNEEFVYGYKFDHKDPLEMSPKEKEKYRSITFAYDYDKDGHMIAHKMNNSGSAYWMDRFEYDSVGNLIFEGRCKDFKGDVSSCECKKFHINHGYEYDQQHHMTRNYLIGDWKPEAWDYHYEYDDQGRETRRYKYEVRGEQRTFTSDVHYTYDTLGNLVLKEAVLGKFLSNISYFGYPMVHSEQWQYDTQGNLILHKIHQENGKDQEIRFQYEYDSYGNWTKKSQFRVHSDGTLEPMETLAREIEYYD